MRWTTCLLAWVVVVSVWPTETWGNTPPVQTHGLRTAELTPEQRELARFLKAQKINTFAEYVTWFERHMTYRPDGKKDAWARPLDTLIRQKGDCEDLAFLNKAMLELFGINGRVLGTRQDKNHHVFLVFEHHQRIHIFDNTRCIRTKARSVEDIAAFLYQKYDIDYLLEVENSPRAIRVLYDKFALKGYVRSPTPQPAG